MKTILTLDASKAAAKFAAKNLVRDFNHTAGQYQLVRARTYSTDRK